MYHWVNQPIAIFPYSSTQYIFSGSAVIDVNNTSGFFPNQNNGVVAIYTVAVYTEQGAGPQTQHIAYSYDGGFTFTIYAGNPVINSTSSQFRDPKVIWYEDHWVMVVAYAQEFAIGVFTSPNLRQWTHMSNFSYHGLLGWQYECPNLVSIPVEGTNQIMYLMLISINPGAPLGGSITQYFPGHFNGTHFTAVDAVARIADFGKDNYAGQFFYGIPDGQRQISIAWGSNWQYTSLVPTGTLEGWRSAMTLPRVNYLTNITRVGWDLVSFPYDMSPVLGDTLASNASLGNGTVLVDFSDVSSNAVRFSVNVTNVPAQSTSGTLNFTFSSPVTGEYLQGGFFFGGDAPFFINRGGVRGFENVFFTDKFSQNYPYPYNNGTFQLDVVFDRSILEVFIGNGELSATATFFPQQPLTQLSVKTSSLNPGVGVSVEVVGLESAWAVYENEQGTVYGNVTGTGTGTACRCETATTTGHSTMGKRHMDYRAHF